MGAIYGTKSTRSDPSVSCEGSGPRGSSTSSDVDVRCTGSGGNGSSLQSVSGRRHQAGRRHTTKLVSGTHEHGGRLSTTCDERIKAVARSTASRDYLNQGTIRYDIYNASHAMSRKLRHSSTLRCSQLGFVSV